MEWLNGIVNQIIDTFCYAKPTLSFAPPIIPDLYQPILFYQKGKYNCGFHTIYNTRYYLRTLLSKELSIQAKYVSALNDGIKFYLRQKKINKFVSNVLNEEIDKDIEVDTMKQIAFVYPFAKSMEHIEVGVLYFSGNLFREGLERLERIVSNMVNGKTSYGVLLCGITAHWVCL